MPGCEISVGQGYASGQVAIGHFGLGRIDSVDIKVFRRGAKFFAKVAPISIVFVSGADGKVTHLDLTQGALLAERVAGALRPALGTGAHAVVRAAVARGELGTDPAITAHLDPARLAGLLAPETYVGSADALIDRALRAARR